MGLSPSEIIIAARHKTKLSQESFSHSYLSIKQPQLSKYENNKSKVPGNIVILCQNILGGTNSSVSAHQLSMRVLKELDGELNQQARLSLNAFLDLLRASQQR